MTTTAQVRMIRQLNDFAIRKMNEQVARLTAQESVELVRCYYETPETTYGACDSRPCNRLATVHHLASELDVCLEHFDVVSGG